MEQWLADNSAHGPPGIIRSDDASELRGGRFAEICRKHTIKREFTSADRPQLNGVAERGLTLIEKLAKAATIQSFKDFSLPATDPLWPEAHNYACDVLNRTATSSNPEFKSPHEMLFGTPPPPTLLEFLQPCLYRVNRKHKNDAQVEPAFCLGPAANHPRDCVHLMTKKAHKVVITRNVTWQHVPPAVPPSSQITPVIMENEESGGDDGNSKGSTSSSGGGEGYSSGDVDHLEVTWVNNSNVTAGDNDSSSESPEAEEPPMASPEASGIQALSPSSSGSSGSNNTNGSNSTGSSSDSSGNSSSSPGGELPKGEAHRLNTPLSGKYWKKDDTFPSRTRSGGQELESDHAPRSSHAMMVKIQEVECESKIGEYEFDDLLKLLSVLKPLNHSAPVEKKQAGMDFNGDIFSLVSSVVDVDPNGIALDTAKTDGKSESCIPSDPVSKAEIPPVSVAAMYKSRHRAAWEMAIDAEIKGLQESKTFTVLDILPKGEKAVGSRWVFAYKTVKDGNIIKPKARLVARGFMQREGVDFFRTPAPTPAAASVKVVMAVSNQLRHLVRHFDVAQAFTKAPLDYRVIMNIPGGRGELSGKHVHLEKALYGLRQSVLL